jgi:hypothetical protein
LASFRDSFIPAPEGGNLGFFHFLSGGILIPPLFWMICFLFFQFLDEDTIGLAKLFASEFTTLRGEEGMMAIKKERTRFGKHYSKPFILLGGMQTAN